MEAFLLKLLSSELIWTYGPLAAIFILESAALIYLYKRHEDLHQRRFQDVQKLKDEYVELVASVDKTLNVLIKLLSKRDN